MNSYVLSLKWQLNLLIYLPIQTVKIYPLKSFVLSWLFTLDALVKLYLMDKELC
jgi:hypothetical protein